MQVFGKDAIIGDFKLSDYGLMLGALDFPYEEDEDLGMSHETLEEYIGHSAVPIHLGAKHSSKLKPVLTLVKDKSMNMSQYFNSHECREVLRQLTGFKGYKILQILPYDYDEMLYFNVRTINTSYKKIDNQVVAITLEMECDSPYAWSEEFNYTYNVTPTQSLIIFNTSDELYDYVKPVMSVMVNQSIQDFTITNIEDNNWKTVIKSLSANETITIDSKNEVISSSIVGRLISEDFNMHFIRLKSGKNEFTFSHNAQVTLKFRVPRKVGFVL